MRNRGGDKGRQIEEGQQGQREGGKGGKVGEKKRKGGLGGGRLRVFPPSNSHPRTIPPVRS